MLMPKHPHRTGRSEIDQSLRVLNDRKGPWVDLSIDDRISLLEGLLGETDRLADRWVDAACEAKGLAPDSPLAGEEWMSGPWAFLEQVEHLIGTLEALGNGTDPLQGVPVRTRPDGQVVVPVHPADPYEKVLLHGVEADVWMQPEVTPANLRDTMCRFYKEPWLDGTVTLVLGAGNISSIPPLDVLNKMFIDGSVCILKMNPVNDYLGPIFEEIFEAFIRHGFLRFAYGGRSIGEYLCQHPGVQQIHITGSADTHDAIVYGTGREAAERKAADDPVVDKRITSELGGVGPAIVVPGPWTEADLRFQAEHLATQKIHNGGFNCVALQVLITPARWHHADDLLMQVGRTLESLKPRLPYYPGAREAIDNIKEVYPDYKSLDPGNADTRLLITDVDPDDPDAFAFQNEFFCGALAQTSLPSPDPETFLREAVSFANQRLDGTLGANILIHPKTLREMGPVFEEIIADLHYGTIGVNAWTGVGFLLARSHWGAFPGHTRQEVGSGIGVVNNAMMFDRSQRTVIYGPFRPFPRSLLEGEPTLLPRPPWFVTHRLADVAGRRMTRFAADPGWRHVPGIIAAALAG